MDRIFEGRMVGLNDRPVDENGSCVIYWMQRSQRATDNLALEYTVRLANDLGKPVLVYFGLHDAYPMASARAFKFMLEGLLETAGVQGGELPARMAEINEVLNALPVPLRERLLVEYLGGLYRPTP